MLKAPKTVAGLIARKITALLVAYSFLATSVWSLNPPGGPYRGAPHRMMWSALRGPIGNWLAANAARRLQGESAAVHDAALPTTYNNFADLLAAQPALDDQQPSNCTIHSARPSRDDGEDEDQRRDEHRSYQHHDYQYGSDDAPRGPNPPITPSGVAIFGPQTYTRTTGPTDDFTSTINVPAWASQPFFLHVVNGDSAGNHRVSSATIAINGTTLISESVFNQNVASVDCAIQLTAPSTLKVDLDSKPGSFLTINALAKSLDHTPPVVTIVSPGPAVNTPQPHIDIRYQDLVGAGETVASGVNTTTLQVLLDGVDRTSLFTRRADEATADLPATLALSPGTHTITASIQDNAENLGQATEQFQVNTARPVIQILQPVGGSFQGTTTPQIVLAYSGSSGLNLASLKVTDNGVDITSSLTKTATGASGTAPALVQGGNTIVASISDPTGNQATATVSFNIDTTPPTITIVHPAPGSAHGSANVEYLIQYSDDQAIDPGTLAVTLDGSPVAVTPGLTSVSGTVTLATSTNHVLVASIKDKAGNPATASSTFLVDTTLPNIHIVQPVNNSALNNPTPSFQVQYSESTSGVDTTTFKASVDGMDVTGQFIVGAASASANLQTALADGPHTFSAQIASTAGNVGQASNQVLIDTIKPQLTIVSPTGAVNSATPVAVAQYSDSGSGIDPTSVHVTLDGVDVTGTFAVSTSAATGTLSAGAGLSEGTHQLTVSVADKAGNVAQTSASFLVDVTPPTASFSSPADNSFINNPQPVITLNYSDSGSGVDPNSIHVFLQQGTAAETEITLLFAFAAAQGTATIPASSALTPGTYHLRAVVSDKAGNQTTAASAFVVDTAPPTYAIVAPPANAFLNTATPTFTVNYQDDLSGVDTTKFTLLVDGVDRTNRLTVTATGASGTLQAADALADGTHQVAVTVVDLAGNAAPIVPQSFLVDTVSPTINISAPAGSSFTNNNHVPITVTYSDSGSGVDVTTFQLLIDGVDHTAEFTASATGASGATAAALLDGPHTITANIKDLAGNPATATALFTVDTVPPVIVVTQPANGAFTNAASILVSGTVAAGAPVSVTVEGSAAPLQAGVFTANVALGAGPAQIIHVVATDAAGNASAATVTVNIDRTPPAIAAIITPPPNAAGWNNTNVVVTFTCTDSGSGIATCPAPVNVSTEGAGQVVSGQAVDNAGNTAPTSVTLNIDKTPPVITATAAPPANTAGWNTTPVTITYVCSDSLSGVVLCPPPQVVSTDGKAQVISASVSDVAGNTASAPVTLNIEQGSPAITASLTPAANAAGWNNTNVTVNFVCTPSASAIVSCQAPAAVTTEGKNQTVSGTVSDQAGKTATTVATVSIDKTPPIITASAAPPANAAGWNNTPVVVSYVCSDALSGVATCPPSTTVSAEGANQNISAQATDQAGNTATASSVLNIDMTPPVVIATAAPPANSAGWNNSNVTVSFSCTDNLSGVASCPAQQIVASEGQNQNISGPATDVAGNAATGSIVLSIDKTPPAIVQVSTPASISKLHPGQVSVIATDNFTVAQVVISVNGTPLGTFTTPPYQTALTVPASANPGDTLTVTAVATDEAGNTQTASRGVSVAADGVVVGQVLSDTTSFPVQKATVQVISATGQSGNTDEKGRYSFQASDPHLFISVSNPGNTTVEREVFVQPGAGTVAVDARLTPLATGTTVGSAGGTLTAGSISMTVPAASVPDGTTLQLTPLSGQGLPNLLPLGWSPLAAFDFRSSAAASNLGAVVANLPNVITHLVTYSSSLHAWTMVATNLQSVNGAVNFSVPAAGAYALVIPDATTPPVPIPAMGGPLTGVAVQALDPAVSGTGSLNPAVLPAGGGTSTATLALQSPSFAPSGTIVQANVSERFSLASGDLVSEETRSEDIVVYNTLAPAGAAQSMSAQFPVTPSHQYSNSQLVSGNIHLDILAGREGVRGQPGGNDPVTVSDGVASLSVPGGALGQDTAIAVQSTTLENFVPTSSSMAAVQEVIVDFSGEILNTPAQLSISASGLNPNDTFVLTQVQRLNGVPHMVAVALAQISGANLTSITSPGLPGVVQGGEYVFYDITAPAGFVQGIAAATAGPVQALVQTDSLQIVSITGTDERYIVPALAGTVNLKANGTTSSVAGTASTQLTAGQVVGVNIQLNGVVNTATVSPSDGSLGVPVSTIITVTSPVALNPQTVQQNNIALFQGKPSAPGAPVAQSFVLSASGTVLTITPAQNLNPATQYTVQVSGLADAGSGAIVVPTSSFTTQANQPLTFDPNAITFAFPDQNGNIQVSAPAGSLPPGTRVVIIDQSNAVVLSLTAFNDGSLTGSFTGTINDILQITATDPNGATATFTRSQFVAPDGSVAVGAGGGTVTGSGGVELRIPSGTFQNATTFQIQPFGPTQFPDQPPLPGANFGGGLQITVDHVPTFNNEVKVAFAKPPDAPDGAFYYVYRRLQGPNGAVFYQTLDHAFVEGQGANAKVVTASPPFPGLNDTTGTFNLSPGGGLILGGALVTYLFLAWSVNPAGPGIPLPGIVTGKVLRTQFKNGQPTFVGVQGIAVTATDGTHRPLINLGGGITKPDGTFVLWAPFFHTGSTVTLTACDIPFDGACHEATAFEITVADTQTIFDMAGPLLPFYKNVAAANITFPPIPPQTPLPQVTLSIATRNADGSTTPITGPVLAGTPVAITAKVNSSDPSQILTVLSGTLQGQPYSVSQSPTDPTSFVFTPDFKPTLTGVYTAGAQAIPPLGGPPVSAQVTFLVIASGGNNDKVLTSAPDVLTAQLVPQAGANNVPTTVLPQVAFSQPVNNVASNTFLYETDSTGQANTALVPIKISGVAAVFDAQGNVTDQGVDTIHDSDNITTITIQPLEGLKYGTFYKISLGPAISDLEKDANGNPAPKHLVGTPPNREFLFQTYALSDLSQTDSFSSPRLAVVGTRAYATTGASVNSALLEYDVSDPVHPVPVPVSYLILGRSADLAGEESFNVTAPTVDNASGTIGLLAVATGAGVLPLPSNIFFFDVSDGNNVQRIGATSVTGSADQQGSIMRMVLKDGFAYTATFQKGIQVVDINQAIQDYTTAVQTNITQFGVQISTDGEGFAQDAVVNTIPVMTNKFHEVDANGNPLLTPATLFDLKAADLQLDQQTQTLVAATGIEALVVVNPATGQVLSQLPNVVLPPTSTLDRGFALALGTIPSPCPAESAFNLTSCNVAVVVGTSSGAPEMVVVDLTDPRNPVPVSSFNLPEFATDVILKDNLALVAQSTKTLLIDLTDPAHLQQLGSIDGVGGRLTLNGFLYSTAMSGPLLGLNVATLGALAYVKSFTPKFIEVSPAGELFTDVQIAYGIIPPISDVKTAEVHIDAQGGGRVVTLPGQVGNGNGTVTWPSGSTVNTGLSYLATVHAQLNGGELPTIATRVPLLQFPVAIKGQNRFVRVQFGLPDQNLFKIAGKSIDKYTVKVFLSSSPTIAPNINGTPSVQVTSDQMNSNAYLNANAAFGVNMDGSGGDIQAGSAEANRNWVMWKIDQVQTPVGTNSPIRLQGFEVDTEATNVGAITVVIFSETLQKPVKVFPSTLKPDGNWALLERDVDDAITPGAACTGDTCPNAGLKARLLYWLDQVKANFGVPFARGFVAGWNFGHAHSLFFHPVVAVIDFVKTVIALAKIAIKMSPPFSFFLVQDIVTNSINFLRTAKNLLPYSDSLAPLLQLVENYAIGYVFGLVAWMAVDMLLAGAVSEGIGAIADLVIDTIEVPGWIARIAADAGDMLEVIVVALNRMGEVAMQRGGVLITEAEVQFVFLELTEEASVTLQVFRAYSFSQIMLEELAEWFVELSQVTGEFIEAVFGSLLKVPQFLDTVGRGVMRMALKQVFGLGTQGLVAKQMHVWTDVLTLADGIGKFMEVMDPADDTPLGWNVGALEGGFIVAKNAQPNESLIKGLITKYASAQPPTSAQTVLFTLKPQSQDTTYSDKTITEVVRELVDPTLGLPIFSADLTPPPPNGPPPLNAVAGLAALLQATQ
jgi:hypothetical protein